MKKFLIYFVSFILLLEIFSFFFNKQEYHYPEKATLEKQINYLERVFKLPLNYESEISQVQNQSEEWLLFSLSFSTFGLTNICFRDSTFKPQAVAVIAEAIQKAKSSKVYGFYAIDGETFDSTHSVLYLGHLNLMLSCYRLLTSDDKYNELNDSLSQSLYNRFINSKTRCLESYEHSIWIPDNTVALASLKLNGDKNHNEKYYKLCREWIDFAKQNFTDDKTNVLCTTIDYMNGSITEEPRGSMLGWSIFFINLIDKEYAKELYENYKKHFSNNIFTFSLYKERAGSFSTGNGDIDSGPLILGYGIPANAWAFGCAVLFNDLKEARKIERLINIGSKKIDNGKEIKYSIRFTNVSLSPLNEALLLYLQTMRDWK